MFILFLLFLFLLFFFLNSNRIKKKVRFHDQVKVYYI